MKLKVNDFNENYSLPLFVRVTFVNKSAQFSNSGTIINLLRMYIISLYILHKGEKEKARKRYGIERKREIEGRGGGERWKQKNQQRKREKREINKEKNKEREMDKLAVNKHEEKRDQMSERDKQEKEEMN